MVIKELEYRRISANIKIGDIMQRNCVVSAIISLEESRKRGSVIMGLCMLMGFARNVMSAIIQR